MEKNHEPNSEAVMPEHHVPDRNTAKEPETSRKIRNREKEPNREEPEAGKEKSFASGLNFYKLFWIFFIACFLGVVVETVWVYVTRHVLQSRRGLIYGPFNCVYGCGAVLMTLVMYRLRNKRDAAIFVVGALLGGVYEYVLSWGQEAILGTVSWQYDNMPFNLHGRINLLYTFFWGILALIWVKELFPRFTRLIEKIPNSIGRPLTWALTLFMVVNIIISSAAVLRMSERHFNVPCENKIQAFLDAHYPDDYLAKVFPSMVYVE